MHTGYQPHSAYRIPTALCIWSASSQTIPVDTWLFSDLSWDQLINQIIQQKAQIETCICILKKPNEEKHFQELKANDEIFSTFRM